MVVKLNWCSSLKDKWHYNKVHNRVNVRDGGCLMKGYKRKRCKRKNRSLSICPPQLSEFGFSGRYLKTFVLCSINWLVPVKAPTSLHHACHQHRSIRLALAGTS